MTMNLEGYVRKRETVTLGGKEFVFAELTLGDLANLWAAIDKDRKASLTERREQLIKDADRVGGIEPKELLDKLYGPMTEEDFNVAMEQSQYLIHAAYLSLKYAHAEVTKEQVADVIGLSDIPAVSAIMFPAMAGEKKTPESP